MPHNSSTWRHPTAQPVIFDRGEKERMKVKTKTRIPFSLPIPLQGPTFQCEWWWAEQFPDTRMAFLLQTKAGMSGAKWGCLVGERNIKSRRTDWRSATMQHRIVSQRCDRLTEMDNWCYLPVAAVVSFFSDEICAFAKPLNFKQMRLKPKLSCANNDKRQVRSCSHDVISCVVKTIFAFNREEFPSLLNTPRATSEIVQLKQLFV